MMLEALTDLILSFIGQWGYLAIFILMGLSSMCIPIPSEIVLLFAGYLAFQGKLSMLGVISSGALGNLIGAMVAYYIGLKGGRPLFLRYGKYVFVKERELRWAEHWFDRFGHETVFFGRMVPVIRAFISVPAGVAEMKLMKFTAYTILGILPWTIGLAYAGLILGQNWRTLPGYFQGAGLVIIVLALVALLALYLYLRKRGAEA